MKDIFKTNWFVALVSFLCAVVIWVYVVYQINPMYETTVRKIPIKYMYQSTDFDSGKLMILSSNSETADIKIRGKRSTVSKLKRDDIQCSVDMTDADSAGTYSLALKVNFNVDGIELTSKSPYSINLVVDDVITVEKDIEIDVHGKPADGFIAESVEYSPLKIRLTGARSIVKKIKTALISVDLTGASDTISGRYKIKLYDKDGNLFSDDRVSKNITYTELKYNIFQNKSIDIEPALSGSANKNGEKVTVSKVQPSKASVIGDKRELLNIDKLETEEIDVSHIKDGDTVKVKLKPLPENARFDEDITEVEVTFKTTQK